MIDSGDWLKRKCCGIEHPVYRTSGSLNAATWASCISIWITVQLCLYLRTESDARRLSRKTLRLALTSLFARLRGNFESGKSISRATKRYWALTAREPRSPSQENEWRINGERKMGNKWKINGEQVENGWRTNEEEVRNECKVNGDSWRTNADKVANERRTN